MHHSEYPNNKLLHHGWDGEFCLILSLHLPELLLFYFTSCLELPDMQLSCTARVKFLCRSATWTIEAAMPSGSEPAARGWGTPGVLKRREKGQTRQRLVESSGTLEVGEGMTLVFMHELMHVRMHEFIQGIKHPVHPRV